jgi:2-oxoisovalerate dehydrogenase E2 component (dihydrolipoyl transacylase)
VAVLALLAVPLAGTALASGTGTSAGDQQYVDPLTPTTSAPTTPAQTTPASSTPAASSTPTTTASSGASSSSAGSTATAAASAPSNSATSGTLPFTGLNVEACVAVGIGLLGAGLLLRRIVARV